MNIIEGVAVSNKCDYTFGDQAGCIGRVPGAFMAQASLENEEFVALAKTKEWMTVFIDNIRLYNREVYTSNEEDKKWVDGLMETNDLLKLCGELPDTKFIIFTNLEDTPITKDIHDKSLRMWWQSMASMLSDLVGRFIPSRTEYSASFIPVTIDSESSRRTWRRR